MTALAEGIAPAGNWPELGDISHCRSRQEVRACLSAACPRLAANSLDFYTGQLWSFLELMRPGDYVAMPLRYRPGCVAIGRVVGRYRYRHDAPPRLRHVRAVEWTNHGVASEALEDELRRSLRSNVAIHALKDDPDGRRLAALSRGEPDPGPTTATGVVVPQPPNIRDLVSVLDVGDGACTVIRTRDNGRHAAMVVDCGSSSISPDEACDRLLEAIDGQPELIDTIVVTHFDADHYRGFVRLAERMRVRGQHFHSLRLISPRPPDVPRFTLSLLTLEFTVSGFRSLDLVRQLQEVTKGQFQYTPLARGPRGAFLFGKHGYEVLWPPAALPPGVTMQVQNAVRRFENLAQSLAGSGNLTLLDNFKMARGGSWLQPQEDTRQRPNVHHHAPVDTHDFVNFPVITDADNDGHQLDIGHLDIPNHLQEEFHATWNAMRRANNNTSLVFEDAERALVVFGDTDREVLSRLAETDLCPAHYTLMLAPHHGTHPLPPSLQVTADLCVSQNGSKRAYLWPQHCATHHNEGHCVSTASGSHHLLL